MDSTQPVLENRVNYTTIAPNYRQSKSSAFNKLYVECRAVTLHSTYNYKGIIRP